MSNIKIQGGAMSLLLTPIINATFRLHYLSFSLNHISLQFFIV